MEFEDWTNAVVELALQRDLLEPTGLSSGEVESFIADLAEELKRAGAPQAPCLFGVVRAGSDAAPRTPESVRALFDKAQSSRLDGRVVVATLDAGRTQTILASGATVSETGGLKWTPGQASRASEKTFRDTCVLLVTGFGVRVFVNGAEALAYADVRDRTTASALHEHRREGWNDGALLEKCKQSLSARSELGIWRLPNRHLLEPRPELRIEERLEWFLKIHLSGFERIQRQVAWEDLGRVDIFVVMQNGLAYVVELKWLGRALKKKHAGVADVTLDETAKAHWAHNYFTVFNSGDVEGALRQLATYLGSDGDKGYLALYDCRPSERVDAEGVAEEMAAQTALSEWQFRVWHVLVDPTVPSSR